MDSQKIVFMTTKASVMGAGLSAKQILQTLLAVEIGKDARNLDFYDEVAFLFDAKNIDGSPKMHELTQTALLVIHNEMMTEPAV